MGVYRFKFPFFINQTASQIRKYWEVRVSDEYMSDGKFDDSGEKFFDVILAKGNFVGMPDFTATFDKKGLCKDHKAKISDDDHTVMAARLEQAGYKFKNPQKWISPDGNHYWQFEFYGNNTVLACYRK